MQQASAVMFLLTPPQREVVRLYPREWAVDIDGWIHLSPDLAGKRNHEVGCNCIYNVAKMFLNPPFLDRL